MTITTESNPVTIAPTTNREDFYLQRFKESIERSGWALNGRLLESDVTCEIYKGFAIVTWKRVFATPSGNGNTKYESFVWEVGGFFDHLSNLAWLSQGCVTTGWGANTLDTALKKVRKKIDTLSLMYEQRDELKALSISYAPRIASDTPSVFNAKVGDVVAIQAFGRVRLGKIVKTTGSRFIVAYMTPSNGTDIHYKTLPLNSLYPRS